MMHIRTAREEDLPALVEFEIGIARISFPEDPVTSPTTQTKKLRKALHQSPQGMFVAEVDGQLVGWLWVTLNTQFLTGKKVCKLSQLCPPSRVARRTNRVSAYAVLCGLLSSAGGGVDFGQGPYEKSGYADAVCRPGISTQAPDDGISL
jgi:hypothetical protein